MSRIRLVLPIAFATLVACGGGHGGDGRDSSTQSSTVTDAGHDAGPPRPPRRAMAKRFAANVRTEPHPNATRIGYVRAGALMRTKHGEPSGTDGCAGGWYELEHGGFVCNGYDVVVFDGRNLPFGRGRQPKLDQPLPYDYGSVRREAPMYRRLPSDEEAVIHEGYVIPGTEPVPGAEGESAPSGDAPAAAEPAPAAEAPAAPAPAPAAPAPTSATAIVAAAEPVEPPPPVTLNDLQGERGSVVLRRVMPGFVLTLDRVVSIGERRYWRTGSSGFVPAARVGRRQSSTDFQGVVVDGTEWQLPIAFQSERGASYYVRDPRGRMRTAPGRRMAYHDRIRVLARETIDGTDYLAVTGDKFVRASDVVLLEARQRPTEVAPTDFWIDVDLEKQALVAYEGDRPVYATLVSSGREGSDDESFRTPNGTWRIESKHITTTMDGDSASDGPYSIDDVPWVMFYFRSFALHGAFWHDRFGHTKSHGCVNLAPLDARWLFLWAPPILQQGWHGAFSSAETPGAWVVVHGQPRE